MTTKFDSINLEDTTYYPVGHKFFGKAIRTVTVDVDGVLVTRKIADNVTDGDGYVKALASGLETEYADKTKTLSDVSFVKGEVLAEKVVDEVV